MFKCFKGLKGSRPTDVQNRSEAGVTKSRFQIFHCVKLHKRPPRGKKFQRTCSHVLKPQQPTEISQLKQHLIQEVNQPHSALSPLRLGYTLLNASGVPLVPLSISISTFLTSHLYLSPQICGLSEDGTHLSFSPLSA